MDRRAVGVALVVLALAAVMAAPALFGDRSSGVAVPIALPSPPAVGDCAVRVFQATADPESTPPALSAPAVRFGSCRGLIAGEVVAFWSSDDELAAAPRSRRSGPCQSPLVEYAGLRVPGPPSEPPVAAGTEPMSWRPMLSYQAYLINPSGLEQRAGREWSACLILPADGQAYRGSLLRAYSAASLPTAFGSCWTGDDSGRLTGPVDCSHPHSAQLLATGFAGGLNSVPDADVTASCSRVAGRLMENADPARGGQLAIVTERIARLTRTWTGNPSSYGCFVTTTGGRQLTGLVLGLGDRPVPFQS